MRDIAQDLKLGILKIEEERKSIELSSLFCTSDYTDGIIEGLFLAENILRKLDQPELFIVNYKKR